MINHIPLKIIEQQSSLACFMRVALLCMKMTPRERRLGLFTKVTSTSVKKKLSEVTVLPSGPGSKYLSYIIPSQLQKIVHIIFANFTALNFFAC